MPPHVNESPAKKQSKWSSEEDSLIIELRGGGMKWEDISKRLPGRSAISCRLHYQNYLERRSEWDEERKNKLARLYERFKSEMWSKIAEEMQLPWRAAEAMHWQLGEADMARRAGVIPFSLSAVSIDTPAPLPQHQPQQLTPGIGCSSPRGHSYSQSLGSTNCLGPPLPRYSRSHVLTPHVGQGSLNSRAIATTRRDSTPRSMSHPKGIVSPREGFVLAGRSNITNSIGARSQLLPSVAEMTTGVTMAAYSVPTYAISTTGANGSHGYIAERNGHTRGASTGSGYTTPTSGSGFQSGMTLSTPVQYSMEPLRMDGRSIREGSVGAGSTWDKSIKTTRGVSPEEVRNREIRRR